MARSQRTGGEFSAGLAVEFEQLTEGEIAAAPGAAYTPPERGVFRVVAARVVQLLADVPGNVETLQTSAATIRVPAGLIATNDAGDGRFLFLHNNGTGVITVQDHTGGSIGTIAAGTRSLLLHNENDTWQLQQIGGAGGGANTIICKWAVNGPISQNTDVDGLRVIPAPGTIISVWTTLEDTGNGSSTIIDIHKRSAPAITPGTPYVPGASATIYSTQPNRPTIAAAAGAERALLALVPDVTDVAKGDILALDIDEIANGAPKNMVVEVEIQLT